MIKQLASRAFHMIASFGFACVVLVLLLLLTFLGTLEQVDHGLFDVQKRYFESLVVVHWLFGRIPIPLPGVYLLMVLFSLNLVCGGLVRIRKTRSRAGIIVGHLGILLLLVGGLVKFRWSQDGQMTLFEGESAAYFQSYFVWEVSLHHADAGGPTREYVIPVEPYALEHDRVLKYGSADLPFRVELSGFLRNSRPRPRDPASQLATPVVDGFQLEPVAPETEAERNVAGMYVAFAGDGERSEGILWGMQHPLVLEAGGKRWVVDLRKRRWDLPFTITLDRFTHEMHPRTNTAALFESDVTKSEPGQSPERFRISMNEPLRHAGYTLYQASWGPADARPGDRLFSTFAVVRNPADKFPLYACLVIAAGLLFHFCSKLVRHIKRQARGMV